MSWKDFSPLALDAPQILASILLLWLALLIFFYGEKIGVATEQVRGVESGKDCQHPTAAGSKQGLSTLH